MKYLPTIAGVILGLLFLLSSVPMLFNLLPPDKMPQPPTAEAKMFMGAVGPTGYLTFVKVVELLGAVLVMIPKTRNYGLLALGPVIVNILAYDVFLGRGAGLANPMLIAIIVLSLYLLWVERAKWAALRN